MVDSNEAHCQPGFGVSFGYGTFSPIADHEERQINSPKCLNKHVLHSNDLASHAGVRNGWPSRYGSLAGGATRRSSNPTYSFRMPIFIGYVAVDVICTAYNILASMTLFGLRPVATELSHAKTQVHITQYDS